MKKLIIPVLSLCLALTACGPKKIDLENITLKEDVNDLIKGRKQNFDQLEMLTALPGHLITDVKGLRFGTVAVDDGGSVEFLLNSLTDKKLAGMDINFKTDASAAALNTYLQKQYGKPTTVLEKPNKVYDSGDNAYRSTGAYLWSNVKPGISMVLLNKNEEINKVSSNTSELIILKNDITPASPLNASTSLDRVTQNYTPLE